MKESEPYQAGENDHVMSEIRNNKKEQFETNGEITLQLPTFSEKNGERGYFEHTVINDNGTLKFKKVKAKDENIFE